jgi:hypothetical protein
VPYGGQSKNAYRVRCSLCGQLIATAVTEKSAIRSKLAAGDRISGPPIVLLFPGKEGQFNEGARTKTNQPHSR